MVCPFLFLSFALGKPSWRKSELSEQPHRTGCLFLLVQVEKERRPHQPLPAQDRWAADTTQGRTWAKPSPSASARRGQLWGVFSQGNRSEKAPFPTDREPWRDAALPLTPRVLQDRSWCLALRECSVNAAGRLHGGASKTQSLKNSRRPVNAHWMHKCVDALSSKWSLMRIVNGCYNNNNNFNRSCSMSFDNS